MNTYYVWDAEYPEDEHDPTEVAAFHAEEAAMNAVAYWGLDEIDLPADVCVKNEAGDRWTFLVEMEFQPRYIVYKRKPN